MVRKFIFIYFLTNLLLTPGFIARSPPVHGSKSET